PAGQGVPAEALRPRYPGQPGAGDPRPAAVTPPRSLGELASGPRPIPRLSCSHPTAWRVYERCGASWGTADRAATGRGWTHRRGAAGERGGVRGARTPPRYGGAQAGAPDGAVGGRGT